MSIFQAFAAATCICATFSACGARAEDDSCKTLVIHMSNNSNTNSNTNTGDGASTDKNSHNASPNSDDEFAGEGTVVFMCNGSKLDVYDEVSIHMMNSTQNGICYTDYSCGNLDLWSGSFLVSARTMNATFSEFLCSGSWRTISMNTPYISVDASFDFLQVSRYCKKMSDTICIDSN